MEMFSDTHCAASILSMTHGTGECVQNGDRSRVYSINPANHKVVEYSPHSTASCADNFAPMYIGENDCTTAGSKFSCHADGHVQYTTFGGNSCSGTETAINTLSNGCQAIVAGMPVDGSKFLW